VVPHAALDRWSHGRGGYRKHIKSQNILTFVMHIHFRLLFASCTSVRPEKHQHPEHLPRGTPTYGVFSASIESGDAARFIASLGVNELIRLCRNGGSPRRKERIEARWISSAEIIRNDLGRTLLFRQIIFGMRNRERNRLIR
jgi:hypothetical protein